MTAPPPPLPPLTWPRGSNSHLRRPLSHSVYPRLCAGCTRRVESSLITPPPCGPPPHYGHASSFQRTLDIQTMMAHCWATVFDAGPTVSQHCVPCRVCCSWWSEEMAVTLLIVSEAILWRHFVHVRLIIASQYP